MEICNENQNPLNLGQFNLNIVLGMLSVIWGGSHYQKWQKWLPWLYHSRCFFTEPLAHMTLLGFNATVGNLICTLEEAI